MVDKMLKGVFSLILLIVVVSITLVLIEPYVPYLALAICLVMFMAAATLIWKVIVSKRKFW